MASFAPGTSQQYMDDYYRRMPRSLGGQIADDRHPFGLPQSSSRPSQWYSGSPSRAGAQSNRPFQGTIPPVVPQQQSPDMSAYTPGRSASQRWTGSEWVTPRTRRSGQAQPVQPQSQGTPYNPGMRSPAPQSPANRYGPGTTPEYMAANPDWLPMGGGGPAEITRQQSTPRLPNQRHAPNDPVYGPYPNTPVPSQSGWQQPSVIPGGGAGNLAYSPPDRRPQPFSTSVRGPDGNQYDPSQFFPMRDAFIQNINDARSSFAANPSAGRPQMDMGRMWNQAGSMASQGYQNPLAGLFGGPGPARSAGPMLPPSGPAAPQRPRVVAGLGLPSESPMPMGAYDPMAAYNWATMNRRPAMMQ